MINTHIICVKSIYTRVPFYCIMVPIEIEKQTNYIMKGDL